jgi:hypothetical protein
LLVITGLGRAAASGIEFVLKGLITGKRTFLSLSSVYVSLRLDSRRDVVSGGLQPWFSIPSRAADSWFWELPPESWRRRTFGPSTAWFLQVSSMGMFLVTSTNAP